MVIRFFIIASLLLMMIPGCGPAIPSWRHDAKMILDRARLEGAHQAYPQEFKSAEDAMREGETLIHKDEVEEADQFFQLAWLKGKIVADNFTADKLRREEELKRKAEAQALEAERLKLLHEEQQRKLKQDPVETEAKAKAEAKKKNDKAKPTREYPLSSHHTVKRGETLPLIAAQPDIYNDPALWPLLYRANRDQIRNPMHIWPGQVLRIPRNINREDLAEARRYAQEKRIY